MKKSAFLCSTSLCRLLRRLRRFRRDALRRVDGAVSVSKVKGQAARVGFDNGI